MDRMSTELQKKDPKRGPMLKVNAWLVNLMLNHHKEIRVSCSIGFRLDV